jgi:hypothetical protein
MEKSGIIVSSRLCDMIPVLGALGWRVGHARPATADAPPNRGKVAT